MICKQCGKDNGFAKKCCSRCGAFLEGRTINNVTGKMGYRHADGSFEVDPNQGPDAGGLFIQKQIAQYINEVTP